jgi:hypothetical protein
MDMAGESTGGRMACEGWPSKLAGVKAKSSTPEHAFLGKQS